MPRHNNILIRLMTVTLLMAIVLWPSGSALAESTKFDKADLVQNEADIIGKGPGYVFVPEIKFKVTKETVILNLAGRPITLQELMVPCRARFTYTNPAAVGQRIFTEIRVLKYYPNASTRFIFSR